MSEEEKQKLEKEMEREEKFGKENYAGEPCNRQSHNILLRHPKNQTVDQPNSQTVKHS